MSAPIYRGKICIHKLNQQNNKYSKYPTVPINLFTAEHSEYTRTPCAEPMHFLAHYGLYISGDFEGKGKFDVALHFTGYLSQLLTDFQNLKGGILSRASPLSIYGSHVSTYVLSSLLEPERIT